MTGRVLPLSRAWHELARRFGSAISLSRTVRGHNIISRPQRIPPMVLCTRHRGGDRASIRVWCSHTGWAPKQRNEVRARDRLQTAPGPAKRKKSKSPLIGVVCLLTKEASYVLAAAVLGTPKQL